MTAGPVTTDPGTVAPGTGRGTPASAARGAGLPAALTPGGAQAVFRTTLDALARPGTVQRLPTAAAEPLAARVPAALLPLLALADLSTPACVVTDESIPAPADDQVAWDEVVRVATNAPRAALAQARLVTALRPLSGGELASLRTGSATAPEDGAVACLAVAGIAIVEGAPPVSGRGDNDRTDGSASAAGVSSRPGDVQYRSGPRADGTSDDTVAEGTSDDTDSDHADPSAPPSGTGDDNATAERTSAGPRAGVVADAAGGTGVRDGGPRLLLRVSGPGVPGTRAVMVTGLPAGFAAARERLVAGFPAGADLLLIAPDGAMTGLPRTTVVREEAC